MHSYADRYTHDFFFERDYPDVAYSTRFCRLRDEPEDKAALQMDMRMDPDLFDKAFEKLWIHGGGVLDYAERISGPWPVARIVCRPGDHKRAQIELMISFAESNHCRMATLVRHFGDAPTGRSPAAFATSAPRPVAPLNGSVSPHRMNARHSFACWYPCALVSRNRLENCTASFSRQKDYA